MSSLSDEETMDSGENSESVEEPSYYGYDDEEEQSSLY